MARVAIWEPNAGRCSTLPTGVAMVSLTALALVRLIALLEVMVAAKAYRPIRDRIGSATRRKILRRMDQRRKPMSVPRGEKGPADRAVTREKSQEDLRC